MLKDFFENQEEEHLTKAADLGREMVRAGVPLEEIAEIYEVALQCLTKRFPDETLLNSIMRITAPLMELLMAYGLADRVRRDKRKQAEKLLKESEERYRSLVENINLGIAVISPEMRVLSVNKQFLKWYPDLDLSTHPICYHAFHEPARDEHCSCCPGIKTLADGLVHEAVTETLIGGEIRNYRIISSPLRDTDGNVIALIEAVEDVTDKLKLENELNKADKLESIGVLAGGIAHDFNNILTSLLGNISLARMESDLRPGLDELLGNAEKALSKAADLTRQLLTFAKGGVPIFKTVSLDGVVRDTAEFALRGSNVKPVISFADDLYAVSVDEGQLSQVINNLVINGRQAMPKGGTIQISCRNCIVETGGALPLPAGNYVIIKVAYQGVGINPEHLAKIFDPFFTTKETGSGLGLASSYSIIRKH
ncbi:MAG: PAS domain S-box protein, partial [Deltaproteobacteria bacterium]|nr:PAS domain S-box protein [Deltaproteobacteria bacterium]